MHNTPQKLITPQGKQVASILAITPKAISQALAYLVDNDHIYKHSDGFYNLVNPCS